MAQTQTRQKSARTRTYARNRGVSRRGNEKTFEPDSVYFLKLVVCILLGSFWIKFGAPLMISGFIVTAIPVGLLLGLVLINRFEKYQSDRKIWYAVIIVVAIVSYFSPSGIVV